MSGATDSMKAAARIIRDTARDITGIAKYEIAETRDRIPESFEGDAATALENRLDEMNWRLSGLSARLEDAAREILMYAWIVED